MEFSEIAYKTYKIKSLRVPYSFTFWARKSVLCNSLVRWIDVNGVAMSSDRPVTFFSSFTSRNIAMFSSNFRDVSVCDILNSVFALSLYATVFVLTH